MSTIQQFRDTQLATDGSVVGFYEREFFVFSNFSSFQVFYRGRLWPTSEHAYQAARFSAVCSGLEEQCFQARSAHEAYRIMQANRDKERPGWMDEKVGVMYEICRAKLIQNPYIKEKLLLTNNELIVEDSPKDPFWGWGPDRQGRNELGKIWMKLREELRNGKL
ncbi:MAG TPA: NADAR family protein [Candidatus Saccharibacteria bacterium]|nr:NADAR family protein [Candidatus Saccharibacteria bacterium]